MMEDLMKTRLDWDLIYLGRKKVTKEANEFFVPGLLINFNHFLSKK
jgi:hypothetical protein